MTDSLSDSKRRKQAYELFQAALDQAPNQRAPFVDENATDTQVANEAHALLRDYESDAPDSFLADAPRPPGVLRSKEATKQPIPESIGPYRIVERIGAGGMGVVYAGIRETGAVRQRVAIKVLAPSVSGDVGSDLHERFEIERHVLSALDHPNIARYIDAGETPDGQPYFVMQLVEGLPIDQYCDRNSLSVLERLELFRKVCSAVHTAHTNLVVHRDLKPSNILVTPQGEPVLLDFGIAKLLNPVLVGSEVVTGPVIRLMTPEYASPEQVRGQPITTLSDVYSLGVLLYQLLTGHRPYQIATRLEQEIIRIICDTEPERPSTAVARLEPVDPSDPDSDSTTVDVIARHRDTKPVALRRQLSGDLDAIIMMALAKSPLMRYSSAQELDADIAGYLGGFPVKARRARRRLSYVVRKAVRRHPTASAAFVAAVLALVVGGAATTWQWRRAEVSANRAAAITESLLELSSALNGEIRRAVAGLPAAIEARQAIADATSSALGSLDTVDARLLAQLAEAYEAKSRAAGDPRSANRGDIGSAIDQLQMSIEIREYLLGENPCDRGLVNQVAEIHVRLADLYLLLGQRNRAKGSYERAQGAFEGIDGDSPDQIVTRAKLYSTLDKIGEIHMAYGAYVEAESLFIRANELRHAVVNQAPRPAPARRNLATGLTQLAELRIEQDRLSEAQSWIEDALQIHRENVASFPEHASYARNLANALSQLAEVQLLLENFEGSIFSAQEALAISTRLLDLEAESDAVDVRHIESQAMALYRLASGRVVSGKTEESLAHFKDAEAAARRLINIAPNNESNQRLLRTIRSAQGAALLADKKLEDAETALDEALAISRTAIEFDPNLLASRRNLAVDLYRRAELDVVQAQTGGGNQGPSWRRAVDRYEESLKLQSDLAERGFVDPATQTTLAATADQLAEAKRMLGNQSTR